MNVKFTFLIVLTILSMQLKAQPVNTTADLDNPYFIGNYDISAIGGQKIDVFKNNEGKYFYPPLIIVDWNHLKNQLDSLPPSDQDEDARVTLLLKIYHDSEKVYKELKVLIERRENTRNINLVNLPYSFYDLKARIGGVYVTINPTDLPTFSNIGSYQTKYAVQKERNYEISGTLVQLKGFYESRSSNDNLKGILYASGFEFSSDYIKGTADFATNSEIKKELFGNETLIDNHVMKSSGGSGGLSFSLGPLKLGGGRVNSEVWAENQRKRILSRNYVSDFITKHQSKIRVLTIGDADRIRETKNDIIKYLLEKVARQVTLEFKEIAENEYDLIKGNIVYAALRGEQVETLLKSKPQFESISTNEESVSAGDISGARKDSGTFKVSDDVTWEYKGDRWIPTKIDMYILSEQMLESNFSMEAVSYNIEGKKQINIDFVYPAAWLANNPQILSIGIADRDNPIGSILAFAGNLDKIPAGWKLCNGDTLAIRGNEEIFNVIGYNWGRVDDDFFQLPDLRGVFLRGVDNNRGMDIDRVESQSGGLSVNDYQEDNVGKHEHIINMRTGYMLNLQRETNEHVIYIGNREPWRQAFGNLKTIEQNNKPIETRPKNVAVNYIIRCE